MLRRRALLALCLCAAAGVAVSVVTRQVKADQDHIGTDSEVTTQGDEDIPIDASNFPDKSFRNIVKTKFDSNRDNALSKSERSTRSLYLYKENISDLTGIEYFENLEELTCNANSITSLNLSKNTHLKKINCGANKLTSLDVSMLSELQELDCGNDEMTSLNISNLKKLAYLWCGNSKLSNLNISTNTALQWVCVPSAKLTSLNTGNNPNLEHIYVSGNRDLNSLDLTNNKKLVSLKCSNCNLPSLNISQNTLLEELEIDSNKITSLSVSHLSHLKRYRCSSNKLNSIDVSNNPELVEFYCYSTGISGLNLYNNTKLKDLRVNNNSISELNVSRTTNLEYLSCANNQIHSLTLGNINKLSTLYCQGNQLGQLELGGSPYMRQVIQNQPTNSNGTLSYRGTVDNKSCYLVIDESMSVSMESSYGIPMSSGYAAVLPDGDYIIASAGSSNKNMLSFMDIFGMECPAPDGSNVSIWGGEEAGPHDVWTITYSNGFYTIRQKGTSTYLNVEESSDPEKYLRVGANVEVRKKETPQRWAISLNSANDRGYRIQSQYNGYSLDLENGSVTNLTNIRTWHANDGAAETWLFIPYKPSQPIPNGRYMLKSGLGNAWEMDVFGNSGVIDDKTNVQLYEDTSMNQYNSFDLQKLDNGYYKILHAASGKALTVNDGTSAFCENIYVATDRNLLCQQWAIRKNGNGYSLIVRSSGLVADVQGGVAQNAANIAQYPFSGNANQLWTFAQAEHKVTYNANGGYEAPATQIKYYKNELYLSSDKPTRPYCTFQGWATSATATTATYQPGAKYTSDKNITLYAVWKVNGAPGKTQILSAVPVSTSSIKVTWESVVGATGYQVCRATSWDGEYTALGSVTETSRTCPGLKAGTVYYFKVRAYIEANGKRTYGKYSSYGYTSYAKTLPAAPSALKISAKATTSLTVAWNEVNGANGYEVYRATSSNGTYSRLGEVTTTSRKCPGLTSGKKYFFKVRAYVLVNGTKYYGQYSSVISGVTLLATPTVKIASSTSNSVTLSWNKISGATGYEAYRSTSANGTFSKMGEVTTTSRKCPGLTSGKTYYFKVRAFVEIDGVKYYGAYSNVVSKTIK